MVRWGRVMENRGVPDSDHVLFTIGHSNHAEEKFLQLLRDHRIDILADVRSQPYSRYSTQYNREPLVASLGGSGVRYLFLGDQLGGRPHGPEFYDEAGHVLYRTVSQAPFFRQGIERVEQGMQRYRVALMCSEEDPAVCHRYLLISRVLNERGAVIEHIRGDGKLQAQADLDHQHRAPRQGLLFAELESDDWKSLRSVLPKAAQPDFSND